MKHTLASWNQSTLTALQKKTRQSKADESKQLVEETKYP